MDRLFEERPSLKQLHSFLEDQSLLSNGRALAEDAASIHEEIIANAIHALAAADRNISSAANRG